MSAAAGAEWKPRSNPWAIALVVTLAAFMEVLDSTIVNVSLPHIAGSLSVSNDESTWALTIYLVANAIVLTISASLSRFFGRRRYFLICIAGFTACSFACGTSTEFVELLIFRALQGFFGGGLQPTQQAIILDTFPPDRRATAFSLTAIATIIGPIMGPVVGGYLTDAYSWHWIFFINVPIGVMTIFGVMQVVQDPPWVQEEHRRPFHFDFIGLAFIILALGGMQLALDRGENADWLASDFIRIMVLASAIGYIGGVYWLLYTRQPIVDLRVFKDRNFTIGSLQIGLMAFVLYASAVLIPQLVQQHLGYTALWAGLLMTPGGVVLVMLIPITARIMRVVQAKYIIAFGGFCLSAAFFYSNGLTANIDFTELALMRTAQTAALAFLFVPISTIAYATLPRRLSGDATALFTMIRNVAGSVGISVSTAMVTNQGQIRNAELAQHFSPVYEPFNTTLEQIAQMLMGYGIPASSAPHMALIQAVQIMRTQVAVLAYADVFIMTAGLTLLMVPLAFMFSATKVQRGGEGR